MTAVAEKPQTELVTVPAKETALAVFKEAQGLDPYLKTIRAEVDTFLADPPSLETHKGRQAYASMAHKIARSKTAIDGVGKELVADLKELPKKIDAERKRWRDTLDGWRDEVRGPLNEWEAAEEARRAAHEGAIQELRDLALDADGKRSVDLETLIELAECTRVDQSWEEYEAEAHRVKEVTVSTLRAALTKQEAREAEQAELARLRAEQEAREQQEREARIAQEAEERARREAEERARAERDAAARREQEAKDAAERREREHQEALAQAQRDAEQAAQRERERHEAEQRRQQEEAAQRQADKEHRARVNRAALQAMLENGMPEDCAKQAITLIARGEIPGIVINY